MKRILEFALLMFLLGCSQQDKKETSKNSNPDSKPAVSDTVIQATKNGYKDFNWGDSFETVKKKAGPFSEGYGIMWSCRYAYHYQYPGMTDGADISYYKDVNSYLTKDKKTDFTFFKNKLFSVALYFRDIPYKMLDDLEAKYGSVPSQDLGAYSKLKVWSSDPGRIIVYKYDSEANEETIYYLDATFYNDYVDKNQGNERQREKEYDQNKQKID